MSRPLRIEYPDAYYHVMNRGRGRQAIFHDEGYFQAFLQILSETHERFGLEVHAYCLMTNHFHLLVKTPEGNLQRAMRHIGGVYTQRYNRMKKTDGSLFRGRYKAILVDADEYLLHLSRYIHRNPLEAKMVTNLEDYRWSSYPSYIGQQKAAVWLYRQEVYGQLTSKRQLAKKYQMFVTGSDTHEELEGFYSRQRLKPILGDDAFTQMIEAEYEELSSEVSFDDSRQLRPSLAVILEAVSASYQVDEASLLISKKGRGRQNIPRKVAMYLAQKRGGYRLSELAAAFGLSHYGGVSNAINTIVEMVRVDRKLEKKLNTIINRFDP